MFLTRKIMEWCDEHPQTGPFVEGLIDGMVLMYVPLTVACWIYQAKLNEK